MTIFCSSLRRSDTGWIQVFILSLTQSDKSSSRGRISVKFIISRQLPFVFRRRVLSSNLLYGKISPDSSVTTLTFSDIEAINFFHPSYVNEGKLNTHHHFLYSAMAIINDITKVSITNGIRTFLNIMSFTML